MALRDLVLTQILTVVGSSWVGIAAGLGRAQALVWIAAMTLFYLPMAVSVYFLNQRDAARRRPVCVGADGVRQWLRVYDGLEHLGVWADGERDDPVPDSE